MDIYLDLIRLKELLKKILSENNFIINMKNMITNLFIFDINKF